jgi:hypothetical protein
MSSMRKKRGGDQCECQTENKRTNKAENPRHITRSLKKSPKYFGPDNAPRVKTESKHGRPDPGSSPKVLTKQRLCDCHHPHNTQKSARCGPVARKTHIPSCKVLPAGKKHGPPRKPSPDPDRDPHAKHDEASKHEIAILTTGQNSTAAPLGSLLKKLVGLKGTKKTHANKDRVPAVNVVMSA